MQWLINGGSLSSMNFSCAIDLVLWVLSGARAPPEARPSRSASGGARSRALSFFSACSLVPCSPGARSGHPPPPRSATEGHPQAPTTTPLYRRVPKNP